MKKQLLYPLLALLAASCSSKSPDSYTKTTTTERSVQTTAPATTYQKTIQEDSTTDDGTQVHREYHERNY